MLEKFKIILFTFSISPVIAYFIAILVCFVEASTLYFNPVNWDVQFRAAAAFFTFVFSVCGVVVVIKDEF